MAACDLKPMRPGEKTRNPMGRPKGALNKVNATARSNILKVFEKVGGYKRMAEWAMENPTAFYQLYGKLIVTKVQSKVDVRATDATGMTREQLERIASGGS